MLIFISDLHLGNHRLFGGPMPRGINERFRETEKLIQDVVANTPCVVLGDVFDSHRPSPVEISHAMSVLFTRDCHDRLLLVGNHDIGNGWNALEPLKYVPGVRVASSSAPTAYELKHGRRNDAGEPFETRVLAMPYYRDPDELLSSMTAALASRYKVTPVEIVAMHCGIADNETPEWLTGGVHVNKLLKIAERFNVRHVISGDWHTPKSWDFGSCQITQCGALCAVDFNDSAPDYGYWEYHARSRTMTFQRVAGPRFHTMRWPDGVKETIRVFRKKNPRPYVRIRYGSADRDAVMDFYSRQESADLWITLQEIPDTEAHDQMIRAMRTPETALEAVTQYAKEQDLTAEERKKVVSLALSYLNQGR